MTALDVFMRGSAVGARRLSDLREAVGAPVALSFGASGVIQGLNVLTGVLLARELGPSGRGELAMVILLPPLLASIGSLGMMESIAYHSAQRTQPLGRLVGTAGAIAGLVSVALVAGGLLLIPAVLGSRSPSIERAAFVYLVFIPCNLISQSLMWLLNGLGRFAAFHALRLGMYALQATGLVGLALFGTISVWGAVSVYLLSNLILVLATLLTLARERPLPLQIDPGLAKALLAYGLRSHWGTSSGILNERLDQFVLALFISPARLGIYVVAVTLTSLTTLIGASVAMVALPTISRLRRGPEQQSEIRRFLRITVATAVAVTLPMVIGAPWLVDLTFGAAFSESADVARILLPAAVILATGRVAGACLRGLGRPTDVGMAEFGGLIVTLVALAALLPLMGIFGAATASVLAYSAGTGWMLRKLSRAAEMSLQSIVLPERRILVTA